MNFLLRSLQMRVSLVPLGTLIKQLMNLWMIISLSLNMGHQWEDNNMGVMIKITLLMISVDINSRQSTRKNTLIEVEEA